MEKGDLKIDKKTVVHCPTEDLANQVLAIADKLGYRWASDKSYGDISNWHIYKKETCYNFHFGKYNDIDFYQEKGCNIIDAEDFLKLHEEPIKEAKPNVCVYYRGDEIRGAEIIKALEKLGGKVPVDITILEGFIYYIESNGYIALMGEDDAKWIINHYTEAHLPELEKEEQKEIAFEPFQRVLVRDYNYKLWRADFFSHTEEDSDYPFVCVGNRFNQCIPYNDDTKHLLGTTESYKQN